jgi:ElaB/YqjD/DUF883 family membrane-anchored ribosome-binding protein
MAERSDELESDRIQQDIERTRQQMSGTIDAIQERLRPSRILHDATASVREAGADSVRRVLSHAGLTAERTAGQARAASTAAAGYARSHPVPLAAVVGGLAVVLIRALVIARRRRAHAVNDVDFSQGDDSPAGGRAPLNDLHVHREFQDWAEPSNATRRTTSSLTSWLAENPLAIGAAVAAAGMVVGVSRANHEPPVLGTDSVRR